MKHKHRLGQNFMIDHYYLDRIILISAIKPDDIILEIGTGYGVLTERLCKESNRVISYEIDKRLFWLAKKKLSNFKNLTLVNGDGLKSTVKFTKVVSNLPYSISRAFIYWLMQRDFVSATVILQDDFLEKLLAEPNSRNYRAISVASQLSFKTLVYDRIPPEAFYPPPKVHSRIVKIEPIKPMVLDKQMTMQINQLFTFRGKKTYSVIKHYLGRSLILNRKIKLLREKRIQNLSPQECLTLIKFLFKSDDTR
ncbi:MAG: 16S rRNA (adenine(1518)-N(6)/adenine(1519)-N(6))-dimethyltransferase RsmA [Nitrososphaeria archaeon]